MGEWKSCTLSSLGTIVGGATPSTKKPENYEGGQSLGLRPRIYQDFQVDIFSWRTKRYRKRIK